MGKTITPDMLSWGGYSQWEGPYFKGQWPYVLPDSPDFWDKTLAVLSATEGKLDALNAYDSCIISVGMVQLCDAGFFLTTNLLGYLADNLDPTVVTGPLSEALKSSNATFKHSDKGWRFQFLDERGEVRTTNMQRELYLKGTGLRNSWTPESRRHVKLWAAGLANIWNDPRCRTLQVKYLKGRLPGFISPSVKKDLFNPTIPITPWVEVARAAFMSFSANNQTKAAVAYFKHLKESKDTKWSQAWTVGLLRELTFGPGVSIYPDRYNRIRPVLENLWGVQLPKTSRELADRAMPTIPDIPIPTPSEPPSPPIKFEPKQIQRVEEPSGPLAWLWMLVQFILSFFSKK